MQHYSPVGKNKAPERSLARIALAGLSTEPGIVMPDWLIQAYGSTIRSSRREPKLDEPYVRQQLDSLRNELARFEDERNVLVNLIRNYETWLRLHGKEVTVAVGSKAIPVPVPDAEGKHAGVSFRGAVLRVLQDAHGEPLHAKEILRRVEELGARTTAKNPLSMISLNIRSLGRYHPVEKAGPRMWRFAGETVGE